MMKLSLNTVHILLYREVAQSDLGVVLSFQVSLLLAAEMCVFII